MEKSKILLIFKIENFIFGIALSLVSIVVLFLSKESYISGMALGMFIGTWFGVLFNHFVQIPKIYGKKDERELVIMIIATSLCLGFGFAVFAIVFLLTAIVGYQVEQSFGIMLFYVTCITMFVIRTGMNRLMLHVM